MKANQANFWQQLETKKITGRSEIEQYLLSKLGTPNTETQQNLLFELAKKVNSYYVEENSKGWTTYSLIGSVSEIVEKKFKEGKRRGLTFYSVRLSEPQGEKFRALQEDLPSEKWSQIIKLAILNQNLVFKYKIWLSNKDLVDFYPAKTKPKKKQDE